ncbi:MAG: T9SS type A sorting domain-containing protein, partial [Bacteroidota bacterium]
TDPSPLRHNYYRLKMVDLDGTFSYSPIIQLDNPLGGSTNSANSLWVYPNPNAGQFTIDLPEAEGAINLALYSVHGTCVSAQKIRSGTDYWTVQETLPSGVYLLTVGAASRRWTQRVVMR